jgi:hypothetical protein
MVRERAAAVVIASGGVYLAPEARCEFQARNAHCVDLVPENVDHI